MPAQGLSSQWLEKFRIKTEMFVIYRTLVALLAGGRYCVQSTSAVRWVRSEPFVRCACACRLLNFLMGVEIKSVPYSDWKKNLSDGPLKPLEPFFAGLRFPPMGGWYQTDILKALGQSHPECKCPEISSELVAKVVSRRIKETSASSSSSPE